VLSDLDAQGQPLIYGGTRVSPVRIHTGGLTGQSIPVDIPDVRTTALGSTAGLAKNGFGSIQSISDAQLITTYQADEALRLIDAAIAEVSEARGKLGALQANGVETTLSSLRISIENLTSSESGLRDTDFAQEMANFTRHNILYQAATAMLGQANQIPQTVLGLLKGG
jgi:flagellin